MIVKERKKTEKAEGIVSAKRKFIWNMIGSTANAFSSFILLTCVTRMNGSSDGGVFSLAFSTAQFLASVGCFEARAIQATDIRGERRFVDYFSFRALTTVLMMFCAVIYVLFSGHTGEKAAVILIVCFYKAIDCMSDSFQGLFQVNDRIDLSGMALGLRVILSTVIFGIVLFFTHDMVWGAVSMCAVSILFLSIFDWSISHRYGTLREKPEFSSMKSLLFACLPLFIGSFMASYIINAPKYAIDTYLNDEIQNYFGFLLMPAFVINLFSLFAFRPMLTSLAVSWEEKNRKNFYSIIGKSVAWILFLTVGGVLGAYLLGIPILNAFSGLDLGLYRWDLVLIMLGGSMNAFITVFYYVLTVMRKQLLVLAGYGVGFLSSLILAPLLVRNYGIHGAAVSYGLPMMITALFFAVCIGIVTKKAQR